MEKISTEINEYLDYCKNIRQMSKITLRNKCSILSKFTEETKLLSIKDLTNQIYHQWIKKEFSHSVKASSLNTYASTILGLIKFHQNGGKEINFNFNSIPHFKATKTTRKFYSHEEIKRALQYTDEVEYLMIKIMSETGMRIAELVRLQVENLEGAKITFIGKGAKPREVYIKTTTLEKLQRYLEKYQIKKGYLWQVLGGIKTIDGEPPTIATVRKRLQRVFKSAGFDGFYPHALRHSFATDLQKKGARVDEIKEMMGHSSIATTERYLHGFEGRLEELFNKYR
ncbi:tyrosine-type recombinase/integrase [Candidatus Saccharibacteria bacterium]|nr:tyrosine-type recombinase/integrase [Candidatus Saccharibacteria bacterium]MBQ6461122.1 tyrosine-type recombinase/integrase [Candidatus Saccharibacteria bacterium]